MSAPIDPRLWRYSKSARGYLAASVAISMVNVAATVVAGILIGTVLAGLITDPQRRSIWAWQPELILLAAAFVIRVVAAWLQARLGQRAAARTVAELNVDLLCAAGRLPTRELDTRRAELETVATVGTAALRPYLAGYVPALFLALLAPPVVVIAIAWQDLISAAIVAATLPLIPIFMVLIGLLTRGRSQRTLAAMTQLSAMTLDLLAGLPTLVALGREREPRRRVRDLAMSHARRAMSALRVAFLSSMVLELLATLSVALVAVGIGLRLVFGEMTLHAGLIALILAPEAYLPLRIVGEKFHAAQDGTAAAEKAFETLDAAPVNDARSKGLRPNGASMNIEIESLSVAGRDGWAPYQLSASIPSGALTVLTGLNGAGKSTALRVLLGLERSYSGRVSVCGVEVGALDLDWWWQQVAWLPQRPMLLPDTLRANAELAGRSVDLEAASRAAGFHTVLDELPQGWNTRVGHDGVGLSVGQRQRLALTRTLATSKPVLLLDEPTAHLDETTEAAVLASLQQRAFSGATVIVVAHRPQVLAAADQVVTVGSSS
ncbi:thiol reductant ABC exporter subunit CydD [Skermania sp. ID1734]|uniref:thiol reductant ABC exporter subunit CydD n=1 Tax=Skermania sp. ID1734 TaxID=2597516 RepID=UPI0011800020|nr:thiol reductant ABC exporter subunit CydD [Skermania sp. ID1734]TSD96550.1 thiol reductant ABC exporter subunit CydD [Skermania sp. ID1734]